MSYVRRLRLDPTQVPTCAVELDTAHPLAALNQHIVSFSQLRDYGAAPGAVVATAATIHGSSIGPGIATSGVAGSHISLPPRPQLIWNSGTVSVLFAALSNSSAIYATLVTKAPTSATREVGLFFNTSWASGLDYADWYGGNATASSAGSVTLGQPTLFTITSAGDIYQGATLVETFSPANISVSAASWYFGEDVNGASGAPANVNYLFFGAWTRVLTLAEIALLNAEPFGMLRPIMRRTWFVPASGGPTTIVLGSRAWDWDGAAPNVALAAALASKQWDWHGDAAALSKEIAPAPAQWDWRGAAPEQSRIVLPTPKAWAWRPSAPALSFPLRLVAAGWRWSGQGAVIVGALTLLLARAVWRWSAQGVPLAGRGAGWLSGVIGGTIRGLLAKDKP